MFVEKYSSDADVGVSKGIAVFSAGCYASAAYVVMRCRVCVCPSVRLSRSYILSKRIKISSNLFNHRVATPF